MTNQLSSKIKQCRIHILICSGINLRQLIHINKFQFFIMNKNESDQSENQGFHVNQPCIDSHNRNEDPKQQKINKGFQPRYISGCGILRKQPKQCYELISDIPIKQKIFDSCQAEPISIQETHQNSVFQLYNNLNEYSLVYSRNKQPFSTGIRCAFQNQINLKCCENNKEDPYKILKEFDQKSWRQQTTSQNSLIFDSKFQCGNLLCAFKSKKQQNSYTLFMQNDTNTYGYNQWFYFSIKNAKKKTKYTFRIANYRKSYSFFKLGLKPLVFSLKKARQSNERNGWYRDGQNITYFKSKFSEADCTSYYTLEFTLQFQSSNDYITLSPYAPYSYSRLIRSLEKFQSTAQQNGLTWKMKPVAHGLTNTKVPYITVSKANTKTEAKQDIVIIARQHPGQSWSSFLVEQIMKEIVQQRSNYSKWITENFVLRIFPMVNVDGVIYGNFRCDLVGYDLNRTWKNPLQTVHPQVFGIKAELQKINNKNGISMCLDLHTHSKEFGAFAYCCVESEKGREFPAILSKITPLFRYPACTFGITPQKQSTARASIFNLTKNINIITIQLSAFGFKSRQSAYPHMFSQLYINTIAKSILYGYHCYSLKKKPQAQQIKIEGIEQTSLESKLEQETKPVLGSDSQPQVDEIQLKVRIQNIFPDQFKEDILINSGKKNKGISKKIKKVSNTHQTKPIHFGKVNNKRNKTPQYLIKAKSNKTQTKYPQSHFSTDSIDDNTIVLSPSPNKQTKVEPNYEQPLYKKQTKLYAEKSVKVEPQRPTKPLNLIEFSLKKLPLVAQEKIKPNMNYIMEESFPLVGGFSYVQKQQSNRFDKTFSTYQAMCRPRVRTNSRKVGLSKEKNHRLEQELPYLCVMSQNKRLMHFENTKDKISEQQAQFRQGRTFHNSILNGHNRHRNPTANKLKNSNKYPNGDLIARINDEFARYDEFINSKKHRN